MDIRDYAQTTATLSATAAVAQSFEVASREVLNIDVENKGTAAVTSFALQGRVSKSAPWRDITPGSWSVADGYTVVVPSAVAPSTLAAGAQTTLSINVTKYEGVRIQAAGAGAVLSIVAGGVAE